MKSKTSSSARRAAADVAIAPSGNSRLTPWLPWAIVLLAVIFAAIIRVRLLQTPLERDEGEYAYAGQLLLHGIPPYREAFNMKFPGVYAAYAVIMAVFGQTVAGIHLGFLLWNAATTVLVFLLGKRLFGASAGAAASAAYALLSLSPGVFGTQAHATHFVVLPVLGAGLLLLRAREGEGMGTSRPAPLLLSGILMGIAILMKQHGVFFAVFGGAYLLWDHWTARRKSRLSIVRRLATFSAGVALPLGLTGIALWRAGVFGKFWFWTFTYAREYVSENSLSVGIGNLDYGFARVVGPNLLIWIFAAAGLLLVWWKKEVRAAGAFATLLLLFSFLAMCPGLYFREHYFVLMLPVVALLAGAALCSFQRFMGDLAPACLFAGALLFAVYEQSDFFFRLSPVQASRRMYSINPFEESIEVGDYLRKHTPEGSRIAVLGSEPQIYFYAHRRAVTGYIYTYGMMEPQPFALTMQNEMIHDIETARPAYIVVSTVEATWAPRPDSSHHIFQWWDSYSAQHYKKMGVAEAVPPDQSDYHWGDLESYQPKADVVLVVYQRKD